MNRTTLRTTIVSVTAATLALMALACTPPPKPPSLVDFEAMRQDKITEEIRKMDEVKSLMGESDQFYDIALEAYDDEELERVKDYALLGSMKYRTAKAMYDRTLAKERMTIANEKYTRSQDVRNEHNSRNELEGTIVAGLERELAMRTKMTDQQLDAKTRLEQAERDKLKQQQKLSAQQAVDAAKLKRTESEGMKADNFAAGSYNRATNALKNAEINFKREEFDRAVQDAEEAVRFFDKAMVEASPKFKAEQDKIAQNKTNQDLFKKADSLFRGLVKIDGRGMIIIVDSLFKPRQSKIDANRSYLLDQIDKLAKEYPSYNIMIAGHTQKAGNPSRNMTLSQTRAQSVRDFFLQRGVPAGRMQTSGYGGTQPAFENRGRERLRNDRVEIIFLYQ